MSNDAHLPGYTIRRPLERSALIPAVGVGVAVGFAAFYIVRLLLERQPVLPPEEREQRARALERRTGRRVDTLGGEMVGGADDLEDNEPVERDRVRDRVRDVAEGLLLGRGHRSRRPGGA